MSEPPGSASGPGAQDPAEALPPEPSEQPVAGGRDDDSPAQGEGEPDSH